MIGPSPICLECKHFQKAGERGQLSCSAFPDGIPDKIIMGADNHRGHIPGDNGIQFEPIKEEE